MKESSYGGSPLSSFSQNKSPALFTCSPGLNSSDGRYAWTRGGGEMSNARGIVSRRAFLAIYKLSKTSHRVEWAAYPTMDSSSCILVLREHGDPKQWFSDRDRTVDALRSSDANSTVVA